MTQGILFEKKDPNGCHISHFAVAGMTRLKNGALRIKTRWMMKKEQKQLVLLPKTPTFEIEASEEFRRPPNGRQIWGSRFNGFFLILLPKNDPWTIVL